MAEKSVRHKDEVSGLKRIIEKLCAWFPMAKEIMRIESLCRLVGFNERQTTTLTYGKPLIYEGKLYSEEHNRSFTTEMVQGTVRQATAEHTTANSTTKEK